MTMGASDREGRVRLAIVAQFPVHYHLPIYRAVAAEPQIDAEVLFMQHGWSSSGYDPEVGAVIDWGVEKFSGYASTVFANASPARDGSGFWKFINPGLIRRVAFGGYDAVYIHGHNHFTHIAAAFAARLTGKRVILRTISNNLGHRSRKVRVLRRLLYTPLYRLAFDRFLVTGAAQRRYYRYFGVPERKLVDAPHIVDNAYFTAAAQRLAPERSRCRQRFGIAPNRNVTLCVAKIRAVKNPLGLIAAFAQAARGRDWTLLWVGAGEQEAAARAAAACHPDIDIRFAGFLDQVDVCEAYAAADLMVLASHTETWGLVVNEALNFGLPVVVTDGVGCAEDLVADRSGLVVPANDETALAAALATLFDDTALRARLSAGARATIAGWDIGAYMRGLRRALGLADQPVKSA